MDKIAHGFLLGAIAGRFVGAAKLYSITKGDWILERGGIAIDGETLPGSCDRDLASNGGLRDDYRWSARQLAVVSSGQGRIEQRTIQVSEEISNCPEWLDFPGVRRVFRILRETKYEKAGRQRRPVSVCFVPVLPDLV